MAHKRSRNGGGDHHNTDSVSTEPSSNGFGSGIGIGIGIGLGTDKNTDDDNGNSHSLLSLFGGDTIHAITEGNPTFARGGFGELSIALQSRPQSPSPPSSSSSSGDNTNASTSASSSASTSASASLYSYVAVKTIHNAMARPGSGRFGGFGGLQHKQQQQQQQKPTRATTLGGPGRDRERRTHGRIAALRSQGWKSTGQHCRGNDRGRESETRDPCHALQRVFGVEGGPGGVPAPPVAGWEDRESRRSGVQVLARLC
mmetsp:Transcript_8612/g.25503  ORF Transcript_8612/g.25503 Transcript_8612/m.25503 type:complete len:257 (+) Transcript_8612:217-987(+)